jgi:uroporphyrinogen-III decarboxylase
VTDEHWDVIRKAAAGQPQQQRAAFIVDSPWIPGFLGMSTIDYVSVPNVWFTANMEVLRRFPSAVFLPGFWVEIGMAAEPSGFGCRMSLFDHQPPAIHRLLDEIADVDRLHLPDPHQDGLMPVILAQYRSVLPMVRAEGMDIRIIAARGPLALAAHLMGVTEFLVAMKTDPDRTHRLLKITSRTVAQWLEAQADVLPGAGAVMVLDDIMGFMGEEDYLQFAHPYLKEVLSLPGMLKILHDDTPNPACFPFLGDLGVDLFNFSHQVAIPDMRRMTRGTVPLLGNVSPLDTMVYGTPEQNYRAAQEVLRQNAGDPRFLLSAGGGLSPGTPGANLEAIIRAAAEYRPGKDHA